MTRARAPKARLTHSALDHLEPREAAEILRRLLASHPELRVEAESHASDLMEAVSADDVADHVEAALRSLGVDDLNDRAGVHCGEYTDPGDAAWALLDKALAPHRDALRRHLASGRDRDARAALRGMLTGLYRVREAVEQGSVLEWAPDFAREAAARLVALWRDADRPLPTATLNACVPEWAPSLR